MLINKFTDPAKVNKQFINVLHGVACNAIFTIKSIYAINSTFCLSKSQYISTSFINLNGDFKLLNDSCEM